MKHRIRKENSSYNLIIHDLFHNEKEKVYFLLIKKFIIFFAKIHLNLSGLWENGYG